MQVRAIGKMGATALPPDIRGITNARNYFHAGNNRPDCFLQGNSRSACGLTIHYSVRILKAWKYRSVDGALKMKNLLAMLLAIMVTVAMPLLLHDCSGQVYLEYEDLPLLVGSPDRLSDAWVYLLGMRHIDCNMMQTSDSTVRKWRDAEGVMHYSDGKISDGEDPAGKTVLMHEAAAPAMRLPLNYSLAQQISVIACIWLSLAVLWLLVFYLGDLVRGLSHWLRRDKQAKQRTPAHHGGLPIEYVKEEPHQILGVRANAKPQEVQRAYDHFLAKHLEAMRDGSGLTPEAHQQLVTMRQAYEALTRHDGGKFVARPSKNAPVAGSGRVRYPARES